MASYLETLVTFRLETMMKDYKRRITKTALYTPKNVALGYAFIKILDADDKLTIRYLRIKRLNLGDLTKRSEVNDFISKVALFEGESYYQEHKNMIRG